MHMNVRVSVYKTNRPLMQVHVCMCVYTYALPHKELLYKIKPKFNTKKYEKKTNNYDGNIFMLIVVVKKL